MLDLASIGIVNHVLKIQTDCRRRPHTQNLIGAHTEMTISQKAVLRRAQIQAALGFIKHDKIVPGALHFGEAHSHGRIIP
jgi:hypothetical protein